MQRSARVARLAQRAGRPASKRGLASEATPTPGQQPGLNPEEVPEPPNVFATVGAMGAGALGAVFIAAVGVWGVFKMAFYVASETGRTINADKSGGSSSSGNGAAATAAADVKVASPLERQAALAALAGSFAASACSGGDGAAVAGWRAWQ